MLRCSTGPAAAGDSHSIAQSFADGPVANLSNSHSHEPPNLLPLREIGDRRLRMAQADAEMTYGEHPGKYYSWIVMNAPLYVNWVRTQPNPDEQLVKLIRFADNAIRDGIPTETRLRDISNDTMGLVPGKNVRVDYVPLSSLHRQRRDIGPSLLHRFFQVGPVGGV